MVISISYHFTLFTGALALNAFATQKYAFMQCRSYDRIYILQNCDCTFLFFCFFYNAFSDQLECRILSSI